MPCPPLDINFKRRSHRIFKSIIDSYAKDQFPKILDVGCGSGVLGRLLEHKKNIFGIEIDSELVEFAKNNCEKIYSIDLEKLKDEDIAEDQFDFIFFADVLEHIKNPQHVVQVLRKKLKHQGYIVFSLPNVAQIQFRLMLLLGNFNYTENGVLAKTHLHFYTYKTAFEFIKSSGLKVLRFYPSGTLVSFVNILPRLLCSQFIFLTQNDEK